MNLRGLLLLLVFLCPLSKTYADGVFAPYLVPASATEHAVAEPEQKAAIFHHDGIEDLILSVKYEGNVDRFAWLVPTPTRPKLGRAPSALFHRLEYAFEDRSYRESMAAGVDRYAQTAKGNVPVMVLERKQVGIYDSTILQASSAQPLLKWLHENEYYVSPKLLSALDFYVRKHWYFVAMRVNLADHPGVPTRNEVARGLLSGSVQAIRLNFQSAEPIYPLRISAANKGKTSVCLYVVGDGPVRSNAFERDGSVLSYDFAISELQGMTEGRPSLQAHFDLACPLKKRLWVTKLERDYMPGEMTEDLTLSIQRPWTRNGAILGGMCLGMIGIISCLIRRIRRIRRTN